MLGSYLLRSHLSWYRRVLHQACKGALRYDCGGSDVSPVDPFAWADLLFATKGKSDK